jgi:membrane-associated HD superfamily phosphohydrolase
MFLGKKFNREKLTESVLRSGQCSSLSSYYLKNKTLLNRSGAAIVIISILALIITIVCFFGQDLIWIQFIPHTKAKMQIISEIPFEYVSKIKTQVLKDQRRMLVAPVYKIEMSPYDTFERNIYRLDELLDAFLNQDYLSTAYLDEFKKFVRNFSEKHKIDVRWSDVNTLFQGVDEYGRTGILVEGLSIVKNILGEGIFDQSLIDRKSEEYFLNIEIEGKISRSHSRTEDEANRHLKLCLSSIEAPADVIQAVFRILKIGIKSNIVFDDAATSQKITRILQETPDVMVKTPVNTVLIEAGSMVTDEDNERLQTDIDRKSTRLNSSHCT